MAKKTISYEAAMKRIEEIVRTLENGNPDIDTLAEQLQEAKKLIQICRERLTKTDEEIKQILNKEEE